MVVFALGSGALVGLILRSSLAISRGLNEYCPWSDQSPGRTKNYILVKKFDKMNHSVRLVVEANAISVVGSISAA